MRRIQPSPRRIAPLLTASRPLTWLALAAAVVLSIVLAGYARGGWEHSRRAHTSDRPELADLVAAVSGTRPVEARLSGGFAHGDWRGLKRGDARPSWQLLGAAGRLRDRARDSGRPRELGALAAAHLVLREYDEAVALLEEAVGRSSRDALLLNDLAAAYIARATAQDRGDDLPRALASAEQAVRADASLAEGWFNRALALEQLPLRDAAIAAWNDYPTRDPDSPWRDEAARRRAALLAHQGSRAEEQRQALLSAIDRSDEPTAIRLGGQVPELARELFEEDFFGRWAQRAVQTDAGASSLLRLLAAMGQAMRDAGGDRLVSATVSHLSSCDDASRREIARAARIYDRARQLNDLDRFADAEPLYDEAYERFRRQGSPFAVRPRFQYAVTRFYAQDIAASSAVAREVLETARAGGFASLAGRALWMLALMRPQPAGLEQRLADYRQALAVLEGSRESAYAASVMVLLSETYQLYGDERAAWQYRRNALRSLDQLRDPRRRHAVFLDTVRALGLQGLPEAAAPVNASMIDHATRWGRAAPITEGLVEGARIQLQLGNTDGARRLAREASGWLQRVEDAGMRARLEPFVLATQAEADAEVVPSDARAAAEQALARLQSAGQIAYLAPLWRTRARAWLAEGDTTAAERDLKAGIAQLERHRQGMQDSLQLTYTDTGWDLFRDLVELQATRQGRPDLAFATAERGRGMALLDALAHPGRLSLADVQRALPPRVTLLSYLVLPERVLAWAVGRDTWAFREIPITHTALGQLVSTFRMRLEAAAAGSQTERLARNLYQTLVAPFGRLTADAETLILAPDGALYNLPFSALIDPASGAFIVERSAVVMTPSVTATFALSGLPKPATVRPGRVLVVDAGGASRDRPALAGVREESVAIAALYASAAKVTGTTWSKPRLLDAASDADVVHFGGHALAGATPDATRLFLGVDPTTGEDVALVPSDLTGRSLAKTRVVVLAACETARGAMSRSEGVLNLARPFLTARAASVLATLWPIDDRAAANLLIRFHRELQLDGDISRAVARAQRAMLADADPLLRQPGSWAAFVPMGGTRHLVSPGGDRRTGWEWSGSTSQD